MESAEVVKDKSGGEQLRMTGFLRLCLRKWRWITLSLVLCMGIGILYIISRQPVYERQEQILIKDQESGGGIGSLPESFSALGLFSSNTSVYNELIAITSPAVMREVIERLHIDVGYTRKKLPHGVTLYGRNQPFSVSFPDMGSEAGASFRVDLAEDGSARLYRFERTCGGEREKFEEEVTVDKWPGKISTPLGMIEMENNAAFKAQEKPTGITVVVRKMAMQDAVEFFMKKLTGELADDYADVIDLTIKDVSVERGVDILNTILTVYTDNWITDKNRMAVATSDFINERLQVIQKELGNVDRNLADLQASTGTSSLKASAEMSLKKESASEDNIVKAQNQVAVLKELRDYVVNPDNRFRIIPVNLGFGGDEEGRDSEKDILEYNELLIERDNLIANSSASNPLLEDYDRQLDARREVIAKTLENRLRFSELALATAVRERAKAEGRMTATPSKALPLLTEERQQKVKEALYLFLLEKREENELSMKFTADNTRVLTPPMGSLEPVAPKTKLVLVLAFILGLAIPVCVIYMTETANTKVRSKSDLSGVKLPFAGEIPQVGKRRGFTGLHATAKNRKDETPLEVVEEGKRDVVNEAFRVIRSNIDFMSGRKTGCKVIMLTSFNPGSGKSFISYNLGLSFALKKKRVLLIDCDLRRGSSSMYVGKPGKGLADYLTGSEPEWQDMLKPSSANPLLEVLPIGKMPPNPAELLEEGNLRKLIDEARQKYDFVIIDCPPVNIVADAGIVADYADMTLFVVRAGLLDKSALVELNEFYKEKKFRNMSMILNGTEEARSRYYAYGNYQ